MVHALTILILLLTVAAANAASWYVAPGASGNGTLSSPGAIENAMESSYAPAGWANAITAGDTIWMRGGTYVPSGTKFYDAYPKGVTWRSYTNEWAKVDGGLRCYCDNVTWRDFEIYCSMLARDVYDNPGDRPTGMAWYGTNQAAINMVMHDTGAPAVYVDPDAGPALVYGCVVYFNGMYDHRPGMPTIRGDGVYAQNRTSGWITFEDNLIFKNYYSGLKFYGETFSASNCVYKGNILWGHTGTGAGLLATGMNDRLYNINVWTNYSYCDAKSFIGEYATADNGNIVGNYFLNTGVSAGDEWHEAISMWYWDHLTFTNNTIVSIDFQSLTAQGTHLSFYTNGLGGTISSDYNTYRGGQSSPMYYNSAGNSTFAAYKAASGLDANSSYSTAIPTTTFSVIRTNKYQIGRANIAVFNWHGDTSISVDISSAGLVNGQAYKVRDAQNYFGTAAATGTYSSGSPTVTLPLNLTAASTIIGSPNPFAIDPDLHTPTIFNAFLLEGTTNSTTSNPITVTNLRIGHP